MKKVFFSSKKKPKPNPTKANQSQQNLIRANEERLLLPKNNPYKDFPALPYFTKLQSNNRVNAVAIQ